MEELIDKERVRWKKILIRIIGVVKTLSRNNFPFRGPNEKIFEKNNGLFCQLIEFVAEFDPIMQEHLRRVVDKEIQHHYLSHKIQNELISLLANEIKEKILTKILRAKYFSVILDCTPDLSHEEQMSIIIRCVDVEDENKVKVCEFFLGFINIDDTTGLGIFKRLEDMLVDLKLNIDDIRGQGYDNGSNMKGKHQGVQKRLIDVNPRAFYIPCGCHSLNLALCDMAKSCAKARIFFGYVQKVYTLFSGSTHRWDILIDFVKGLTPKALSVTRWESHVKSVRAIRSQAPELRDALIELANKSKEDIVMSEAKGLCKNALEDFEFLISLCIWYKILDKVNQVSKILQREEMDIEDAITRINGLILFFEELRKDGFEDLMNEAKELAHDVGIDPVFAIKRVVRRKKQFDDDVEDDIGENQSPEDNFTVTYFLHIIDQALTSLKDRFDQFELYEATFGFLLNAKFKSVTDERLKDYCSQLESFLKHNEHGDIDGDEFFHELRYLKLMLPEKTTKAIDILDFIRPYWKEGGFKMTWIAFQNEFLDNLKYDGLIEQFASKNARRSIFL